MRIYFFALCWAAAILLLALTERIGRIERDAADLLLMVLPMIAFVTLLPRASCPRTATEA